MTIAQIEYSEIRPSECVTVTITTGRTTSAPLMATLFTAPILIDLDFQVEAH